MKHGAALVALAVLLVASSARSSSPPKPPPKGKGTPPPPRGKERPYIPTPPAVAARAMQLLPVLRLHEERVETDPSGGVPLVLYRAEWHGPSAAIPKPHKGISVYVPATRTEGAP